MNKNILIVVAAALIVAVGLYINDHKQSDLRADFVKQVKNLPNGDLTSTQCKKMYDDFSEKETLNFGLGSNQTADDYTYITSKKLCIALVTLVNSSWNSIDGSTIEIETIKDLGSNSDIYFYSYKYGGKELSEVNIKVFGKEVSTSTMFTGGDMLIYLKDNLK